MRAARCYKLINQFFQRIPKLKEQSLKEKRDFKDKLRAMLLNRIYQHLTSFEISDGLFDPGDLTFSIEGLTILDKDRHHIQDGLRDRFFKVINQSFFRDTPWKPVKPINSKDLGRCCRWRLGAATAVDPFVLPAAQRSLSTGIWRSYLRREIENEKDEYFLMRIS